MSSDQPQDAPHPQDARRGEHVEVVEQAMDAEPAPARVSRRTRLRRALGSRRPARALLRPAALVAAGLVAGILLTLGVGALGRDHGDRGFGPGPGAADGRGGWDRGDGHGDRDRGDDSRDGSTDDPGDTTDDDTSDEDGTTSPETTSPETNEPTPSGTA